MFVFKRVKPQPQLKPEQQQQQPAKARAEPPESEPMETEEGEDRSPVDMLPDSTAAQGPLTAEQHSGKIGLPSEEGEGGRVSGLERREVDTEGVKDDAGRLGEGTAEKADAEPSGRDVVKKRGGSESSHSDGKSIRKQGEADRGGHALPPAQSAAKQKESARDDRGGKGDAKTAKAASGGKPEREAPTDKGKKEERGDTRWLQPVPAVSDRRAAKALSSLAEILYREEQAQKKSAMKKAKSERDLQKGAGQGGGRRRGRSKGARRGRRNGARRGGRDRGTGRRRGGKLVAICWSGLTKRRGTARQRLWWPQRRQ